MFKLRRRRLLIIPALLAMAFGAMALGPAAATAQLSELSEDEAYSAPTNGWQQCNGGAQVTSLVNLNDVPWSLGETAGPVPVPGFAIPFAVPGNQSRQVLVRYDAEARLQGQPPDLIAPVDFLRVVITLNGVPMSPDNDQILTTDAGQAAETSDCRRVGPGNYVVQVWLQVIDQDAMNVLTGTVDDQLLEVRLSL